MKKKRKHNVVVFNDVITLELMSMRVRRKLRNAQSEKLKNRYNNLLNALNRHLVIGMNKMLDAK
jgi:hypothetical protein